MRPDLFTRFMGPQRMSKEIQRAHPTRRALLLVAGMICLLGACTPLLPEPNPQPVTDRVETSVASTLTALPTSLPATNAPLPTPTETLPATPTFIPPPTIPPTATPFSKSAYACDIINQKPLDDTTFHRQDSFDIKWTLVNIGTQRWPEHTYLEYQNGPEMTDVKILELPRLKPGGQYDVVLDATVPNELDRQIMVWAVYGPGTAKDSTVWMCYPYVRIIVER